MNIYIYEEPMNYQKYNVRCSEELLDFLFYHEDVVDMQECFIFKINPYSDCVLTRENIVEISKFCEIMLSKHILSEYNYESTGDYEPYSTIRKLLKLCDEAIREDKLLLSYGD